MPDTKLKLKDPGTIHLMALDTSIIYHLNAERAAEVFQKIGADYETVVVEPILEAMPTFHV